MKCFLVTLTVFLLVSLFPLKALSSEGSFFKYSVNAHGGEVISSQKGLSFGHQDELLFLDKKWEVGFWADDSGRPGAKSSAFGSYSIGLEPTWQSYYVNFFQGVGLITNPDTVLGGYFQFFEDLGIGVRDQEKGIAIGLQYKHISSAGIYKPNLGRDTLGIQLMIPW